MNWTARTLWRRLHAEFAAFGIIGGICLVSDIVLFNLFAFELGMPPVLAKGIDMVITGAMAFFGHRYVTFRHRSGGGVRREVPVFVAVTLVSVALGLLPLIAVRHLFGISSIFWLNTANLLGVALGTAARYVSYRGIVWKAEPYAPDDSGSRRVATGDGGSHQVRSGHQLQVQHELVSE
jgi:putative flippase GtrA